MAYISKRTGEEVDALLDKVERGDFDIEVDTSLSETSNNAIANGTVTKEFSKKVDKIEGKVLSTNDYTDADKAEVAKISNKADKSELSNKQDTLTLTTKPNGNLVIGNLARQTKEFMPATLSGDPMHKMYEAVGAVYNSTDNDIAVPGIYGDTIIHKAGFWLLNEVGDLSNDDMAVIVANPIFWNNTNIQGEAADSPARTTIPKTNWSNVAGWYGGVIKPTMHYAFFRSKFVTIRIFDGIDDSLRLRPTDASGLFRNCSSLTKVLNVINFVSTTTALNTFAGCTSLSELRIAKLKISLDLHWSPLSVASAIYLLQNADATAQFTVTFRADRQAIYEANADFMSAKSAKTNITILYQ